MAFEVFHPKASKKEGPKPGIRLSKHSLVLNKIAREKLNTPEYIELAFDKGANTIRIKASSKNGGIALKKTKVFAKGFYNHFKIEVTGNYSADYNHEEDALYVSLG